MLNNQGSQKTNTGKGINRMNGKSILKYAAVAAAVACMGSSQVYAAGITINADDSNYFATSTGVYLHDGNLVEVGQFSQNDATIAALASGNTLTPANYATLLADFIPLSGVSAIGMGTGTTGPGTSGSNAGAISGNFSGTNPGFSSGAIYVMVINSNSNANATQVGVFKGDSTWMYPLNMATGSATADTDQALTTPLIGTFAGGLSGAANAYNNGPNGNANSTVGQLRLDPIVPEPSTYLLVGTGLLGLLGLRRRS